MNATSDATKTFIAAISGGKQKEIYGSAYQTGLSTKEHNMPPTQLKLRMTQKSA